LTSFDEVDDDDDDSGGGDVDEEKDDASEGAALDSRGICSHRKKKIEEK
jgi:hypothetical protein